MKVSENNHLCLVQVKNLHTVQQSGYDIRLIYLEGDFLNFLNHGSPTSPMSTLSVLLVKFSLRCSDDSPCPRYSGAPDELSLMSVQWVLTLASIVYILPLCPLHHNVYILYLSSVGG